MKKRRNGHKRTMRLLREGAHLGRQEFIEDADEFNGAGQATAIGPMSSPPATSARMARCVSGEKPGHASVIWAAIASSSLAKHCLISGECRPRLGTPVWRSCSRTFCLRSHPATRRRRRTRLRAHSRCELVETSAWSSTATDRDNRAYTGRRR